MAGPCYAELVARTTTAEATNTGTLDLMQELGQVLVKMSAHNTTCKVCATRQGRVYRTVEAEQLPEGDARRQFPHIREGMPRWPTYKTVHPNCAHRLLPYVWDQKTADEQQAALAEAKKPFDLDPRGEAERLRYEKAQKENADRLRDRKQWERYKAVLGDEAPKTLSGFRRMKAAGSERWLQLQEDYRDAHKAIVEQQKTAKRSLPTNVDLKVIRRQEYRQKFDGITNNPEADKTLVRKAIDMLEHRSGTEFEDMHLIDSVTGKVVASQTHSTEPLTINYNESLRSAISRHERGRLIAIHNHPNSHPPSGSDLASCFNRGYKQGVIACHDGTVYVYQTGKKVVSSGLFDAIVDKFRDAPYYLSATDAGERALEQFARDYGIKWEVRK